MGDLFPTVRRELRGIGRRAGVLSHGAVISIKYFRTPQQDRRPGGAAGKEVSTPGQLFVSGRRYCLRWWVKSGYGFFRRADQKVV